MKKLIIILVISILIVGCNKDASNNTNAKNINNNSIEVNNTTSSNIELSSDDTKIVFKLSNMEYVFYYDDNTITHFYTYVNYGTNEKANEAIKTLQLDNNVNNYYVDDKYIVIEWNESEYQNMTLDDVYNAYSYMEEVIK